MSIFTGALADFIPKALGMGTFALVVAFFTRRNSIKLAEKETARLFRGNNREA